MKKLFENWRKYTNEAMYEPGRAVADIDTGEERMSPEDLMRDEVQDLADKFGVEASVRTASDGKLAIMVKRHRVPTRLLPRVFAKFAWPFSTPIL